MLVTKLVAVSNDRFVETAGDVRRVPRQVRLETHDAVEQERRHEAERDEAQRVRRPALLVLGVDAQEPVRAPLDGQEHAVARAPGRPVPSRRPWRCTCRAAAR